MEIKDLRKISISNLILIILNDKNNDLLRKCAEIELKKRIKNVSCAYDDILHFDDKVIKKRGLDVDNYLISPNVNMQQLMEVYFNYNKGTNYYTNDLLFSEKHLCNEMEFGDRFFGKVVAEEIKNLDRRINESDTTIEKELFIFVKQMLEERQKVAESVREESKQEKDNFIEFLCSNEAMCQFDDGFAGHEFWYNLNDEEIYRILKSPIGRLRWTVLEYLNDTLFDIDSLDELSSIMFIRRDSRKLNKQKKQLLEQVKSGFEVDYQSKEMCKVIHKVKRD